MYSHRLYRAYPSDLTDEQWELLKPLIPPLSPDAAYWLHERREIVNGILYVLRSGCPWRSLPHDLPAWGTVYFYFRKWQRDGTWDQVLKTLRMHMRQQHGRDPEPSAAVIDSQSIPQQCGAWSRERLRYGKKCEPFRRNQHERLKDGERGENLDNWISDVRCNPSPAR